MSKTIALVDDDRNILTSLSIALEREGFKVQTYIDGESALVGLSRNPPDLAVVDIKMPRMDGEELLKRIKKKMSIPIIFLTSKDEEVDELLGLKLGADDFIKKSGGFMDKPTKALSPSMYVCTLNPSLSRAMLRLVSMFLSSSTSAIVLDIIIS